MAISITSEKAPASDRSALLGIFLIPLIWGIGFPLTHNAVSRIDPGLYAFLRSLVALIALFPFALPKVMKANRRTLLGGIVLGCFSALNILGQSYALSYVSSATAAFLVSLNIVFIPFVMYALGQGAPSKIDLWSVAIGLAGAYIILGPKFDNFSAGYLWGGLAAFAIAVTISVISKLTSGASSVNRLALSFYQILFGMLAMLYFPLTKSWEPVLDGKVMVALLFMGVFSTALAIYLQTRFQQRVGGTRTSLIFNLDLVFASLFGLINKEALSFGQVVGGSVIFLASMLDPAVKIFRKALGKI